MRSLKPLSYSLCLLAALASAQSRNALPAPDLPGFRTLKCDFHLHTVFSDGQVWPTTRVTEAWRDGLDAVATTDHAGYNPHKEDVRPDLLRPHAIAQPLADRLGIILVPGVEVMEGNTHCNMLFVTDQNAFMGLKLVDALREGRKQSAFAFWNHPGWKETPSWIPLIASAYDEGILHGIELVNGDTFYPEAFPWVEEKKLTIIANSDEHAPMAQASGGNVRPITLVFARTADAEGIREALHARRTAAWMGGEVWGSESHLTSLWEGSVSAENPKVSFPQGVRQAALRLRNRSAFPFQLRAVRPPSWLSVGSPSVRPESIAGLALSVGRDAPAGTHAVQLEFEVSNFHVDPERNLVVRLPVEIEVVR